MQRFDDGNATMMAWDYLLELDTNAATEELLGKEYIEQLDEDALFREGIDARICELGYAGSMDDSNAKVAFIWNQFLKHEIDPISKATLKNWLVKAAPTSNQKGRENVFKLCFALEMDAAQTAEFMLKAYLCRPFNYKNAREAVFFFCLLNGKGYNDALRIIDCVENSTIVSPEKNIYTEQIGEAIAGLRHESDMIDYLSNNTFSEEQWHYSAKENIKKLLKECKELARNDGENESRAIDVGNEEAAKRAEVIGNGRLLSIIYGYDIDYERTHRQKTIQKSEMPKSLRKNWIDRQAFENISGDTIVSDEVYRKALIILDFYHFFQSRNADPMLQENGFNSCADEFEDELDGLLNECGFMQLYKRNPFDWFILHCASYPDPIQQFRCFIQSYLNEDEVWKTPSLENNFYKA